MYRNYEPPLKAEGIVGDLLDYVPEKFLVGLDCVILTNQSGLSRRERLGKVPRRGRKMQKSEALGFYHPRSRNQLPWIELYVDKIVSSAGRAPLWVPFVRDFLFAHVLYHEIGHHIHYEKRPEHREKEDVADEYATRLTVNFVRKKYQLLMPVIVPVAKAYNWFRRRKEGVSRRSKRGQD